MEGTLSGGCIHAKNAFGSGQRGVCTSDRLTRIVGVEHREGGAIVCNRRN